MQPSEPKWLAATCEGWRVKSGGGGPNQPKNKIKRNRSSSSIPYWTQKLKFSTQNKRHDKDSLYAKHLQLRCSSFKRKRWTKDDESAMQPSAPMPFTATCEGWRVRSGGGGSNQPKNKIKTNRSSSSVPCWIQQLKFSTKNQRRDKNSLYQKHLHKRSSAFKWDRWTKDDESAMQPSAPMSFTATCEGWRVRSGGGGPNQTKTKIKRNNSA